MASRRFLLEADEILTVLQSFDGKVINRETGFLGEFGNFDWISHWLTDDTVKIIRTNAETLGGEDITEECARQWLIAADEDGSLDYEEPDTCEAIMPLYVKRSKAWARWLDDAEAEQPVNLSREYGTYSTVNGHVA